MNQIIYFIYNYCTDFVINIANLINSSYYEVNLILFCLIYPLLVMGLPAIYIIQRFKIYKLRKMAKNQFRN